MKSIKKIIITIFVILTIGSSLLASDVFYKNGKWITHTEDCQQFFNDNHMIGRAGKVKGTSICSCEAGYYLKNNHCFSNITNNYTEYKEKKNNQKINNNNNNNNNQKNLGNGQRCSSDLILHQNLRAPRWGYIRNGKYDWYTKGIVREADILQKHLNRLGFNAGPVDGIIGPKTRGAILRLQRYLGTTPDGYVGPITRGLLNNSCSKNEGENNKENNKKEEEKPNNQNNNGENNKNNSSSSHSKSYKSDNSKNNSPVCAAIYDPVCAKKDNKEETYSNSCFAQKAKATIVYSGKCKTSHTGTSSNTKTNNKACSFNGMTIPHGTTKSFYSIPTVAYGKSCDLYKQIRKCNNGVLSGSNSYKYTNCSVKGAKSCSINGTTLNHGESKTFYSKSVVPYGSSCDSYKQTRTCMNGVLSGSESYEYLGCDVEEIDMKKIKAVEDKYKLPVKYKIIEDRLNKIIKNKEVDYYTKKTNAKITKNALDCYGNKLQYYTGIDYQSNIAYIASTLYSGYLITKDINKKLSEKLKEQFLLITDKFIENANAKDVSKNTIGWTNLASDWDAYHNGTCSSKNKPNAWASGWVMNTLADAYKISHNSKYLSTFKKASSYWHQTGYSKYYNNSYKDYEGVKSVLDKTNQAYFIGKLYTIGGSSYQPKVKTDNSNWLIRYHYYDNDPGLFTLNISSLISLAMIKMGELSNQYYKINIPNTKKVVTRSYSNIGFYGMYPVYANIKKGNYSYNDKDSYRYKNNDFEAHYNFTVYYIAEAGKILNNKYFINMAHDSLIKNIDRINSYGFCLNRELDDKLFIKCKSYINKNDPKLNNIYNLYKAINILGKNY